MAKVDWDTNEYTTGRQGFEPMPKGRYPVRIDEIERKDTRAGDGYYLAVTMVIEDGQYKGRNLWANLNVSNPSEVAQRIGREQFNALCDACGFEIGSVRDTKQLVSKRLVALVDIEKGRDGNEDRNRVTAFLSRATAATGGEAKTSAPRAAAQPAQPASAGAKKTTDDFDDDIPF